MDYEKKYKEALKKAEEIIRYYKEHNRGDETSIEDLEQILPELKESEDEKIKKEVISIVKSYRESCITEGSHRFDDCIAWLEKQGEQKSITIDIDKMVSKYSHTKDGDFRLPINCQIKAYRKGINDALNLSLGIKKQGEQKPTWSGEDDRILDALITSLNNEVFAGRLETLKSIGVSLVIDWLKSLKQRIKG